MSKKITKIKIRAKDSTTAPKTFSSSPIIIGRHPHCDYILNDKTVSREHIMLEWDENNIFLTDLGSSYGTTIDSKTVEQKIKHKITSTNKIKAGESLIYFDIETVEISVTIEKSKTDLKKQIKIFREQAEQAHSDYLNVSQKLEKNILELQSIEKTIHYKNTEKEALETLTKKLQKEQIKLSSEVNNLKQNLFSCEEEINLKKPELEKLEYKLIINKPQVENEQNILNHLDELITQKQDTYNNITQKLQSEKKKLKERISQLQKNKELLSIKTKLSSEKNKILTQEQATLEESVKQLQNEQNLTQTELSQCNEKLFNNKKTIEEQELSNKNLCIQNNELKDENVSLIDENKTLILESNQLIDTIRNKESEKKLLEQEVLNLDYSLNKIKEDIKVNQITKKELEYKVRALELKNKELTECENKIKHFNNEIRLAKKEINLMDNEKNQLQINLENLKENYNSLFDKNNNITQSLKNSSEDYEKLLLEIKTQKNTLTKIEEETQSLRQKKQSLITLYKNEQDKTRLLKMNSEKDIKKLRDREFKKILHTRKLAHKRTSIFIRKKLKWIEEQTNKFNTEKDKIISEAKSSAQLTHESNLKQTNTEISKLKIDYNIWLNTQKENDAIEMNALKKSELNKLNEELSSLRLKSEEELNKLVLLKKEEFERKCKSENEAFIKNNREKINTISERIEDLVINDVPLIQKIKEIDSQIIANLREELKLIVNAVLTNNEFDKESIQSQIQNEVQAKINVRKFWKKVSIYSTSVAALLLAATFFFKEWNNIQNSVKNKIEEQKIQTDKNLKTFREERIENFVFKPNLTENYKDTYVDNIVYTKDFLLFKTDKELNKSWVLKLNQYFVKELDLSDRVIVKFIPLESKLISELTLERKALTPQSLDKGLNSMKEIEQKFIDEALVLLEGQSNFNKLKELENDFYQEWILSNAKRKPAQSKK